MGGRERHPAVCLLLAALLSAGAAGCLTLPMADGPSMVDATGVSVPVSDLSRLVPTSHDLVEMLFELGHRERVVAVPGWIDHPPGIEGLPRIGKPHVIQVEEILAQDPSLVLLKDHPLQPTDLAAGLRQAGIPVFVFRNDETFANLQYTYETLGRILSHVDPDAEADARDAWEALDAERTHIQDVLRTHDPQAFRALYQLPVGFVAGADTSADVLLDQAGAQNLARTWGIQGYQQVAEELILTGDPERVVASWTAAASPDVFFANPRYQDTTAARLGPETLRIVDPATTALVGPRFVDGLREIAEWLHPAAFGLISANVTHHLDGRTLHVQIDAQAANTSAPLRYRLDPGDGSPPTDTTAATLTHDYPEPGIYEARILIIDPEGRIDEHRRNIQIP